MATIADRLRAALKAFRTTDDYTSATIRPYEAAMPNRQYERAFDEMAHRYSKYVKVCVSLRATSLASLKPNVARRVKGGKQSKVWHTKRLGRDGLADARSTAGRIARKRFEMSDDYEVITDPLHPAVSLFENVNGSMNGFDLFEQTEMLMCLTGNFYWMIVTGKNGWPTELWPMYPQFVTIKADRRDMVKSYLYGTGIENEVEIDADQVVHFKRPNPLGDPLYGMGDLASCINEAELSAAFSEFALKYIDNGCQPGIHINDPNASKRQREELIVDLRRQMEGVRNAGRSFVTSLSEKATTTIIAATGKEAGFLAGQSEEVVKKTICACFGVPVGLVDMQDFSLANGQVAAPHFQIMTVLPAARRIEDKINERIMPMLRKALNDDSLVFWFENPVRGDAEKERNAAVSMYGGGIATLNEARQMAGLDPVEEGDDFKAAPVPIGMAPNDPETDVEDAAEPDPEETGDASPRTETDAGDGSGEVVAAKRARPPAVDTRKSLRKLWLDGTGCGCKTCVRTKAYSRDASTPGEVGAVDAAVGLWLDSLTMDVLQRLPKTAAELATFDLFGGSVSAADLIAATRGPLEQTARTGIEIGFADLGVTNPALEVASERIRQYVANAQKPFVESVTASVDAQIRSVLEAGINQGSTLPELSQQVAQVLGNNATSKASLIATTETANIYNGAKELAWEAVGTIEQKEWLLSGDPCPICVAIWEQKRYAKVGEPFVGLGESIRTSDGIFVNDYKAIMGPTAHPRCRCGMAAVIGGSNDLLL